MLLRILLSLLVCACCAPRLHAQAISVIPPQTSNTATTLNTLTLNTSSIAPSPDLITDTEASGLPTQARGWESLGLLSTLANEATTADGAQGDAQAAIADGTQGEGSSGGSAASGLSYSGLSPTQNAATLDGLSLEQNFASRTRGFSVRGSVQGGPVSGASFGQGAVRSFRVMPGSYNAEFGGASSAVLAIDSREAGAPWHGQAFSILRFSLFDAANPYSLVTHYRDQVVSSFIVKPSDTTVQLGGHISIPLGAYLAKHHLTKVRAMTTFASWEEMMLDAPAFSSPETADFYDLTASQVAVMQDRGLHEAQWNTALNYLDSLTGTIPRFATRALGFVRVDDPFTRRDHLTSTYAHNRFRIPAGSGFRSTSDSVINRGTSSVGDSFVSVDAVAGHWLHAFSPHFENILRTQFVRDFDFDRPRTPLAQEPAISPGGYAPDVEIEPNGFAFGTPASLGKFAYPDERRVQLVDTLQALLGRHLVTLGADWSRITDTIDSTTNTNGTFLYDSIASGLVDWITDYTFSVNVNPNGGCPHIPFTYPSPPHYFCFRSYTQNFTANSETYFVTHTFAGFVQDAFRARNGLTFNIGLRDEYVLLPLPQRPNPVLDESLRELSLPISGLTSSFPEDRNNLAARVAIAWSPNHTRGLTAHLGHGWFYGRIPGTLVQTALADTALTSSILSTRIRPTDTTICPQITAVQQGFGYPCAFISTPSGVVQQTSRVVLFAPNFRLPAVQRADLSLQHSLGKLLSLRASYAMALATQLPSSVDINIETSTSTANFVLVGGAHSGETFAIPLYTSRRLASYGPITAIVSKANATYHSGTLEAELHEYRGLTLRTSYTFSRAIDYAPLESGAPRINAQFDPFRIGYDKGLSSLDFPNRFSAELIAHASLTHGPAWLQRVLAGYRIASIATAGSGAPYSYEISGGTYLSGGRESINGSGGATYLPTVGRNTLRLAPRGKVDLRLERTFLARKFNLTAFVEAFNLLNERNLTSVETSAYLPLTAYPATASPSCTVNTLPVNALVFQDATALACEGLTTPAFGQATSSTSGTSRERQAELGVRLQF